ncbi:26S proteasome non-ATPase regulatory subunit 10 [Diplonema papillatum]|nr:26S proteasome non-ATPase regulatory subunit 10 [Diplonema papillatum]
MKASELGHTATVARLLAAGATVDNVDEDRQTALFKAQRHNHTDVIELLLQSGAVPIFASSEDSESSDTQD